MTYIRLLPVIIFLSGRLLEAQVPERGKTLEGAIYELILALPADSLCRLTAKNDQTNQACQEIKVHPVVGSEYYSEAVGAKREWSPVYRLPRPLSGRVQGKPLFFGPFRIDAIKPGQIGYAAHVSRKTSSSMEVFVEIFIGAPTQWPLTLTAFAVGTKNKSGWVLKLREISG